MSGRARHFDVLVIGAGSSGSVIASRLSANSSRRIGLVEAGALPDDPDISDPLKWPMLQNRAFDWAYRTTPQPHTAGRIHEWPRGRIVGGSSCLHAMAYVRGHPDDFDTWREAGGDAWGQEAMAEGYRRAERPVPADHHNAASSGPLDVWLPDTEVSPIARAYMAAGRSFGVADLGNHNRGELIGTAPNTLNIRDGRRLSVAGAYLTPEVLARQNLTLLTGHEVEAIRFSGPRTRSVSAFAAGQAVEIEADMIVLAAGAVATPLLLMRSGIGDPDKLAQADITCISDRRQVGRNLQDHLLVLGNVYKSSKPVPPSRLQHSESLMYLSSNDVTRATGQPDIVLGCAIAPSLAEGLTGPAYGEAYTILCGVTHPTSRGEILPSGPYRNDRPIIDPHYLETEYDRVTFRKALRMARAVGAAQPLDEWREREVLPGAGTVSDADIDAFVALAASTHHHPAGTCRMGSDVDAIVDPDLRVNGFDNLFAVDASILPTLTSGPINASVVAIAENWSSRNT